PGDRERDGNGGNDRNPAGPTDAAVPAFPARTEWARTERAQSGRPAQDRHAATPAPTTGPAAGSARLLPSASASRKLIRRNRLVRNERALMRPAGWDSIASTKPANGMDRTTRPTV